MLLCPISCWDDHHNVHVNSLTRDCHMSICAIIVVCWSSNYETTRVWSKEENQLLSAGNCFVELCRERTVSMNCFAESSGNKLSLSTPSLSAEYFRTNHLLLAENCLLFVVIWVRCRVSRCSPAAFWNVVSTDAHQLLLELWFEGSVSCSLAATLDLGDTKRPIDCDTEARRH